MAKTKPGPVAGRHIARCRHKARGRHACPVTARHKTTKHRTQAPSGVKHTTDSDDLICHPSEDDPYNPCHWALPKLIDVIAHPFLNTVIVASHRGLHALVNGEYAHVPENSLQSIGLAAKAGVSEIELDVKLDKSGTPVLSHDTTLGRETTYGHTAGDPGCDKITDCFDPFDSPSNVENAKKNPKLDSLTTTQLVTGDFYLRNSVSLNLADNADHDNVVLLASALNFMTTHGIRMILALDMRTPEIVKKVLPILAARPSPNGESWLHYTLLKVPFLATPSPHDVEDMLGQYKSVAQYQPVFNTGDPCDGRIHTDGGDICRGFESANNVHEGEVNLIKAFDDVEDHAGAHIPAVEVQIKQYGKQLQYVLDHARYYPDGKRRSITMFMPYQDVKAGTHGLPTNGGPYFFTTEGYCCVTLSSYFFRPPAGDEKQFPPDTADNRTSIAFIKKEHFNGVTTDNWETVSRAISSQRHLPGK